MISPNPRTFAANASSSRRQWCARGAAVSAAIVFGDRMVASQGACDGPMRVPAGGRLESGASERTVMSNAVAPLSRSTKLPVKVAPASSRIDVAGPRGVEGRLQVAAGPDRHAPRHARRLRRRAPAITSAPTPNLSTRTRPPCRPACCRLSWKEDRGAGPACTLEFAQGVPSEVEGAGGRSCEPRRLIRGKDNAELAGRRALTFLGVGAELNNRKVDGITKLSCWRCWRC